MRIVRNCVYMAVLLLLTTVGTENTISALCTTERCSTACGGENSWTIINPQTAKDRCAEDCTMGCEGYCLEQCEIRNLHGYTGCDTTYGANPGWQSDGVCQCDYPGEDSRR